MIGTCVHVILLIFIHLNKDLEIIPILHVLLHILFFIPINLRMIMLCSFRLPLFLGGFPRGCHPDPPGAFLGSPSLVWDNMDQMMFGELSLVP